MEDNLKLYVRGFFGSRTLSTEAVQKRHAPLRSVFDLTPEAVQHVVSNETIIEIYNQVVGRQVHHVKFDYRERVIRVALRSFGVDDFRTWLEVNKSSPTFTQLHADFLMDTLRFIATGKRKIPVDSWERMISTGTNDPFNKIKYDEEELSKFESSMSFGNDGLIIGANVGQGKRPYAINNVVNKWLSHIGGFSDMVVSLYILFGDRPAR